MYNPWIVPYYLANWGESGRSSPFFGRDHETRNEPAAWHRVPAIFGQREFPMTDGLLSYGPDLTDTVRRAAGYVDRILNGEKPIDLPVQAPTKHELVINLKTAKALGLEVPSTVLARADEVIE
jgi:putative tryptophan/tyrosine transport system substrate-binding protein